MCRAYLRSVLLVMFQLLSLDGYPGNPPSRDMLENLLGNHFSVHRIAQLLQTSLSTVRRLMHDFGLCVRSTYSIIDDAELDTLVRELQHQYPNCGYHLLKGHVAAIRYRIQESRIRDYLQRVDPINWRYEQVDFSCKGRTYSVSGPNALWYIDGNHKVSAYIIVDLVQPYIIY